jgi:hypothetical protein
MLRFLADENFNNDIGRGLLRRKPAFDIVRVQDVGLRGADDPTVLAWAAQEGRILITHDVKTITKFAYERITAELPMPGVIELQRTVALGTAIEDLLLIAEASTEEEWSNKIGYLPL